MATDYKKIAQEIIENVGGEQNVKSLIHCATRLRFVLKDETKVNQSSLDKMPIVMQALANGGQYQIVIGPQVNTVYDAVMAELGNDFEENENTVDSEPEKKQNIFNRLLATISAIFSPYIHVLAAVGVLKGLVILLQMTSVVSEKSLVYVVLNALSSGVFTMLPIFIAVTAAKRFKTDQYVAIALAAALLVPLTMADFPDVVKLGAISIPFKVYGGAVLPTIFAVYFLSIVEKWVKKIIPQVAALVFVPTLSLLITGFVVFMFIGPLANFVGLEIAKGYAWLYKLSPAISGGLLAGIGQFFVIFGIHWGIIPIGQINVQVFGFDTIMAMFMSAVFGQFGAVVGSIVTAKNKEEREISFSAAISAFFGITEPALYGVNVKKRYPFIAGCIGAAVGGALTGLLGVKLYGFAPVLNVFMLGMFNGPESKVIYEVIAIAAAFIIAATLTIILGLRQNRKDAISMNTDVQVYSPIDGEVIAISEVDDSVFSTKMMGDGFAVKPANGKVFSPVNGTVTSIFPTKHAISLKADDGTDILVHMGIDTVDLNGEGFTIKVTEGQKITPETQIAEVNLDVLKENKKDNTIIVIFPENEDIKVEVDYADASASDKIGIAQ